MDTNSSGKMSVFRVVLGSKKEVLIREPKIRDQNMAMQVAASRAKDNPMLMVTISQSELLKQLLVAVNGQEVSRQDVELLDELFSLAEYNQLLSVMGQITGGKDMGEFQIEHTISGSK